MIEVNGIGVLGQEREPAVVDGEYRTAEGMLVDVPRLLEVFIEPTVPALLSPPSDDSCFSRRSTSPGSSRSRRGLPGALSDVRNGLQHRVETFDIRGREKGRELPDRRVHLPPPVARGKLRMADEVEDRIDLCMGDIGIDKPLERFRGRHSEKRSVDDSEELPSVLDPRRVRREPGILREARADEHLLTEPAPLPFVLHGEVDESPIRGLHVAIGRDCRVMGSRAARLSASVPRVVRGIAHPFSERLEKRHFDGASPPPSSGASRARPGFPNTRTSPPRYPRRRSRRARGLFRAGDGDEPRLRLDEKVIGLPVPIGAARTVPRYLAGDQVRRAVPESKGSEAEPLERSRAQIREEHIRAIDELLENAPSFLGLQIERERFLRPIQPDEVARHSANRLVVVAGEVTRSGTLDLDDASPEVRELAGRERPQPPPARRKLR